MEFNVQTSPHVAPKNHLSWFMLQVLFAMVPGILVYSYYFGVGLLVNIGIASVTAITCEVILLKLRRRELAPYLLDCTAIITATLLAIAIPSTAPWWITVLATSFAMVFGKHIYGGLGYNPFNPAMLGYVVVLISFPTYLVVWPAPHNEMSILANISAIFTGVLPEGMAWDAVTAATPLDRVKTDLSGGFELAQIVRNHPETFTVFWNETVGEGWLAVNIAFAVGGLFLIARKIIGWQIPLSMLLTLTIMTILFDTNTERPGLMFQLFSGATMVGAFFIATDPVSASTTPRGRLFYGAGVGFFVFVIRKWGGYPDAIAFSVLLMNIAAPVIDQYTKPRVYGYSQASNGGSKS